MCELCTVVLCRVVCSVVCTYNWPPVDFICFLSPLLHFHGNYPFISLISIHFFHSQANELEHLLTIQRSSFAQHLNTATDTATPTTNPTAPVTATDYNVPGLGHGHGQGQGQGQGPPSVSSDDFDSLSDIGKTFPLTRAKGKGKGMQTNKQSSVRCSVQRTPGGEGRDVRAIGDVESVLTCQRCGGESVHSAVSGIVSDLLKVLSALQNRYLQHSYPFLLPVAIFLTFVCKLLWGSSGSDIDRIPSPPFPSLFFPCPFPSVSFQHECHSTSY